MDFQSRSLTIFYRISIVVHGVCVDIFWNSQFCMVTCPLRVKSHSQRSVSVSVPISQYTIKCDILIGFC